jgi:hypothetical protein
MKRIFIPICLGALLLGSCELFENIDPDTDGLSEEDIINGLKTALTIGTDSSSTALSVANGYYGDALVKIPLPDDAKKIQQDIDAILSLAPTLSSYLNLDNQFENVVKSVNRAAEESAKEAAPIFKTAITDLSISQGMDILSGKVPDDSKSATVEDFDSTAATQYLQNKTFAQLTGLYAPKIDLALDKDLGLGFSANQAWTTLRNSYNNAVNKIHNNFVANAALSLTGYSLDPLETESIGTFATEKALNGLFLKVGNEEKKIRKNPFQWASDIIQKVFGYIQEQY